MSQKFRIIKKTYGNGKSSFPIQKQFWLFWVIPMWLYIDRRDLYGEIIYEDPITEQSAKDWIDQRLAKIESKKVISKIKIKHP